MSGRAVQSLRRFTGHDDAITGPVFTIDDKALASSSADCTILIWDISAKAAAKSIADGVSKDDWQALRGEDAPKAFTAMRALAAHPETALKIANEQLKPSVPLDPQWPATRLQDLDNPKFAVRERATRELEESGDVVTAALERFLAAKPSVEAKERVKRLLERICGQLVTGQGAQALRALELLEWIGTAKAKKTGRDPCEGGRGSVIDGGGQTDSEEVEVVPGVTLPSFVRVCYYQTTLEPR